MIRVFVSRAGEPLWTAPDRRPDLVIERGDDIAQVASSTRILSNRELATLRLATADLEQAPGGDIVLAAGGALFHVNLTAGAPAPERPPPEERPETSFARRGGKVFVVESQRTSLGSVLREVLELVGYDAIHRALSDPDPPSSDRRARDPEVLIVLGAAPSTPPPALPEAFAPRAAILVGNREEHIPAGWDSVVSPPLHARTLVSVIDPLVERVRLARARG
jgi:hypothetical protein